MNKFKNYESPEIKIFYDGKDVLGESTDGTAVDIYGETWQDNYFD